MTIENILINFHEKYGSRLGSNSRPLHQQSDLLPITLIPIVEKNYVIVFGPKLLLVTCI